MTENTESEPDWAEQLKDVGKKYVRFMSMMLDSAIQDLQPKPRSKKSTRPKQVANPKPPPKPQRSGVLRWLLKGPEGEEDSSP